MKKLRGLVLLLAVSLLLGSAAMAAGNLLRTDVPAVVYDGATGDFTLEHIQGGDLDDLFPNFKNLMPGDVRTQDITLAAKNIEGPTAFYLTSTPDEATKSALEPLTISVSRDGTALGEFAHSALENVPLSVFPQDGVATLRVTLTVPSTVGNDLASAQTALKWDFTAQPAAAITITPASISSYVGGVSSNDSGAPTLRFHVKLPSGLDLSDSQSVTMILRQAGKDPITMTPRKVEGSESYYCFPTLERGLQFVGNEKFLKGDFLTLTDTFDSDSGSRDGRYAVGLVNDPSWYITAVGGSGTAYTVQVLPGDAKVYVRYVHSDAEMIDHPSSALTKVVSDPAKVNTIVDAGAEGIYRKAVAVISEDATYYTNGKSSGLGSFQMDPNATETADGLKPPLVALLFDDTVSLSDSLTDKAIEAKMIEHAGHAKDCGAADNYSFDGWNYNFRYLDLVNYTDGNAWVSTSSPITIYWPYPEEALADPGAYEYQILHYRGMSRSYAHKALTDIDAWEAELLHNGEKGAVKIVKEALQYHEKEKGISFTLEYVDGSGDNFSPFVLMWRRRSAPTPPPVPPTAPPVQPTPSGSAEPLPSGAQPPEDTPLPSLSAGPSPAPTEPEPSPGAPTPSSGEPAPSEAPTPSGWTPPTSAPSSRPGEPILPQTGQDWLPVLLTAAAGSLLLLLGLQMGKGGKKGKHET